MIRSGTLSCQITQRNLGSSLFRRYEGREITARMIMVIKAGIWWGGMNKRRINHMKMKKPKPISQFKIRVESRREDLAINPLMRVHRTSKKTKSKRAIKRIWRFKG